MGKLRARALHPFNMDFYVIPKDNFETYGQFFLRELKKDSRPLASKKLNQVCKVVIRIGFHSSFINLQSAFWSVLSELYFHVYQIISSPCDCGGFYLTVGSLATQVYQEQVASFATVPDDSFVDNDHQNQPSLPGKSGDTFGLVESIPRYGYKFLGGQIIDLLLWFTDYHHFHSPVDGKVLSVEEIPGSYNYDFNNFNPYLPYAPRAEGDSDQVQVRMGNFLNHLEHLKIFSMLTSVVVSFLGRLSVV